MLTPTAAFRLKKDIKRSLATILDPHRRGEIRRAWVQAQLHSQIQPRRERRDTTGANNKDITAAQN